LYNKKLLDLYSLPSVIWVIQSGRIGLARHVACMGARAQRVLLGKAEGKRPHGRPRHRWENNGP